MSEFTKRQRMIVPNIHDASIYGYWMLPGDKLCIHTNVYMPFYWTIVSYNYDVKKVFTFLNQCSNSHKENNMLKLWDKSEKDIDNQRIALTCIGTLQTDPRN